MKITNPAGQKKLDAALTHYKEKCATFEAARDVAYQQNESVVRLKKGADDAENDAKTARQTCISLMRDPSTPAEKLRELRSIERSSYSIAEDYRILADDQRWDADDAEIETTRAIGTIEPSRKEVFRLYADLHLEAALTDLDALCRTIRLYALAYDTELALKTVFKRVAEAYHNTNTLFEGDDVIAATRLPSGMDDFNPQKWTGAILHKRAIARTQYNEVRQEKTA